MVTIFVARGETGSTSFIGEVERGQACRCSCLVCGSPLVAKQGEELDWHFAHEAGQERPECPAGAFNLLRRLAVEEMIARGAWVQAPYTVTNPFPGLAPLEWTARQAGPVVPAEADGSNEPAAWVTLEGGMTAGVFVCIGKESPPAHPSRGAAPDPNRAQLILSFPSPEGTPIRTEEDAREFLRRSMQLRWGHLPDWQGLLRDATVRANAEAARRRAALDALQAESAQQAGERWAAKRRALTERPHPPVTDETSRRPMPNQAGRQLPVKEAAQGVPAWAPGLMVGRSIQYRELDDDSRWVCYPASPSEMRMAPVPEPYDGWDECFPPGIAAPGGAGWLVVTDYGKLLMLLRTHTRVSHITSDTYEIQRMFMTRNAG